MKGILNQHRQIPGLQRQDLMPRRLVDAVGIYSSHFITPSGAAAEDLLLFLEEVRQEIHDLIMDKLLQKKSVKWYCVSKIRFSRETPDGDVIYATPYFRIKIVIGLDNSTSLSYGRFKISHLK
ncbi:hypothetical protein AVEN_70093-1 [Araneus ventricosus]|uniref:Uncharacterized protein n=1 Tax=Araneus ventricosus TaxID=182803 RepID=A0A4Y2VD30_ARAVE|nr:hypothetical protein AVEN_70093-1 [Araneus ventricosus]